MSRKNKITAQVKARLKKKNMKNNRVNKPRYISKEQRAKMAESEAAESLPEQPEAD